MVKAVLDELQEQIAKEVGWMRRKKEIAERVVVIILIIGLAVLMLGCS